VRIWIPIGVILAVVGSLLFWNGLSSRFGDGASFPSFSRSAPDKPNVPPEQPTAPVTIEEQQSSGAVAADAPLTPVQTTQNQSPTALGAGGERSIKEKTTPPPRNSSSTLRFDDDPEGYKLKLAKDLASNGWTADEMAQLGGCLTDARARFRADLLIRNATFKETPEQYAHNLTETSIARCLAFMLNQQASLDATYSKEGVPAEVLTAILKVETNLGEYTGKESVFNVFWTLALGDDPEVQKEVLPTEPIERVEAKARMTKRAFWARGQLRDLLYMARHGGEDPVGIMGSFAGAFGLPQFIPSSYRAYGKDGNGDGVVDLDDVSDAIASIGYYLKENGWQSDANMARKRRVILSYNPSTPYADCVLALADSISARRKQSSSR